MLKASYLLGLRVRGIPAFNFQLAEPLESPSPAPEALLSSHPPCKEASEMDVSNNRGESPAAFTVTKLEPGFKSLQ